MAAPLPSSSSLALSIDLVALHPGHVALSLQRGRLLAVFDAVSSSHQLAPSHLSALHSYLRAPVTEATPPFPHLLALPTLTSHLVHLQLFDASPPVSPPAPPTASHPPAAVRLLAVQADGSFHLWQWAVSPPLWSHISRGSLPVTHCPPSQRRLLSAIYLPQTAALLWHEAYRERSYAFIAAVPDLSAAVIDDVATVQPTTTIPLLFPPLDAAVPTLHPTAHGAVFAAANALHYWHVSSEQLLRLAIPGKDSADGTAPLLHTHPLTRQLHALTPTGTLWSLQETPPDPSAAAAPFASEPLAQWQLVTQLAPPEGQEGLFPLPASAQFFAFQHSACVVTPTAGYVLMLPGGVYIDRFPVPISPPVTSLHSTRYGLSGTGSLLCNGCQLYSVVAPPLSAQLARMTSASPYADLRRRSEEEDNGFPSSDTFASPSFSPGFPSLAALSPPSLPASLGSSPAFGPLQAVPSASMTPSSLIPGVPYPALSHMAAEIAASYGPSLQSQHQQQLLSRWMGTATASSPAHLAPAGLPSAPELPSSAAMLKEALSTLQSPALPLAMVASPSASHWLHGHQWDAEQSSLLQSSLTQWLQWMEPLKAARDRSGSKSSPRSSPRSSPTPAASLPLVEGQSHEFLDRFTPLNVALYPLLASASSTLAYLHTVPGEGSSPPSPSSPRSSATRAPALPASLALPSLPPLSLQLSRAVASRSSLHASSGEASLSSLTLSSPSSTFLYLRGLMGLDHLTPLSSPQSTTAPRVHPNMLLLNDEIRLKKELGVFGMDVAINTAGLQRSDAMPFFELLCRLYDQLQPHMTTAFVRAVDGEQPPGDAARSQRRWQRAVGDRDLSRYADRALQCLPTLAVQGPRVARLHADAMWMDRLLARCWLLKESARLVEAVVLMLQAAKGAGNAPDIRLRCEEEAITLAYTVSPELLPHNPGGPAAETSGEESWAGVRARQEGEKDEDEVQLLRAELYHHLRQHFIAKALAAESRAVAEEDRNEGQQTGHAVEAALKGLDARITSLNPPHFTAQHLGLLLSQQQLHEDVQ